MLMSKVGSQTCKRDTYNASRGFNIGSLKIHHKVRFTHVHLINSIQSPTLGAHTHAHGFLVGMGTVLLFMGGHG